jgi:hypothetical protein
MRRCQAWLAARRGFSDSAACFLDSDFAMARTFTLATDGESSRPDLRGEIGGSLGGHVKYRRMCVVGGAKRRQVRERLNAV